VATAKKSAPKPRAARGGRARARPRPEPAVAPPPAPPPPIAEVTSSEPPVPLSVPEPVLAARVPPAPAERPLPTTRRAIFFDVENTSRAEHIARVISHLAVDRNGRRTEFFAVGNWRVIGHDTARLLARHGAHLVHSAPSVGVRDWSDLRIAVASGVWLASARPSDVIEIVSDDRAFDAVGDVAASLGVTFHRLSYRGLLGMPQADVPAGEEPAESSHGRHGGSRSRRGRRGRRHGRPEHVARPAPPSIPAAPPAPPAEPHTAPHDEIVAVVRELAQSGRAVTLDSLANALKARGFSRPPGSPRLITRLRRIKELEVNRSGVITLHDATAHSAPETDASPEVAGPEEVIEDREPVTASPAPAEVEVEIDDADVIEPGNDRRYGYERRPDDGGQGRRRSRRGGRRRRGGRGGGGGGGGGRPPVDHRPPPRDTPPRDAAAREAAVREAFRTRTAPSYITGEPLA
jgi:hypothetical protein